MRYGQIELAERRLALQKRLRRLRVTAPIAGTVHALRISAARAVVGAGETLLSLIPQERDYVATLRVEPRAAAALWPGQAARIRTAAQDRAEPDLSGTIARIAPAPQADPRTGRSYIEVTVELAAADGTGAWNVSNGMPVEALIPTGQRTALNYLAEPILRYFRRAMRDG